MSPLMSDSSAEIPSSGVTARRRGVSLPRMPGVLRTTLTNLRHAFANDGIRRLGITWTLGIAADTALTVVTIVTVYNRAGVLAAGVLGAVRMIPAVAATGSSSFWGSSGRSPPPASPWRSSPPARRWPTTR
jgi:hypothetical protein